ncbi:MAG: hypothetical protein AAGI03_04680 [Pseudomonadota bacterium]
MYTDLQSSLCSNESSGLGPNWYQDKAKTKTEPDTRPKRRSILARFIKPTHKRLSKVLGYALTLASGKGWQTFSAIAAAYLSDQERVSLAFAALRSLDPDLAEQTAAAALKAAGSPLPPFLGGLEDARQWASIATPAELKAHGVATHEAMSLRDKAAFFKHISEVEIVA